MPTVRTVTVKSSGGDYSSLSSAEAGEQGDLVSLDRQLDIECHGFTDTAGGVAIDGWTTDATRFVRVYAHATARHAGVWDGGKYNLTTSGAYSFTFQCREDYVRLEGLQLRNSNTAAAAYGIFKTIAASATSDIRIDACILWSATVGTNLADNSCLNNAGGQVTVRNSVLIGGAVGLYTDTAYAASVTAADNCTVVASNTYGCRRDAGTVTLRNVYSGGHGTDAYNGTITKTTCAHSTATTFTGSTANVAYSTANFTNVTATTEDLHLVSGSALIDAGTDLSGTFTTDINGATRSAPWDIGADEFAGGGATGQPTWRRFGGVAYGRAPVGVHGVGVY